MATVCNGHAYPFQWLVTVGSTEDSSPREVTPAALGSDFDIPLDQVAFLRHCERASSEFRHNHYNRYGCISVRLQRT